MADVRVKTFTESLLDVGGELGGLVARHDWAATALGPIDGWPESLKTILGVMLLSPVPMVLLWGSDGVMLYNDAYSRFAGGRHPRLLGSKVREGWPEVADFNDHVMRVGLAGGTLAYRDQELTLYRHGRPEQVFMNLDYSPVLDEARRPAGVLAIVVETTDHVAARRALKAEHDRSQGILDNVAEGFVLLDRGFRVVDINPAGLAMDGRPREALIGRTHWELWPASVGTPVEAAYRRVMDERTPVELEERFGDPTGDGETWFDIRAYPAEGGIALFYRDVTDRRRADRALVAERDRSREILESLSDAFYAIDRHWRFTYVNNRAKEWWGRGADDLIGAMIWDEFPQAVGSESFDAHRRAMRERAPVQLETFSTVLHRWIAIDIHPTAGGGLSVYFRDISDRRRAEDMRRASEARLAAIFAEATVGLAEVDLHGRFVRVNEEFCRVAARGADDLLQRVVMDVTHPDDVVASLAAMAKATTTGASAALDKRYLRPDGSVVWANSRVTRLHDSLGEPGNLLVVTVDLTERMAAEARVRESESRFRLMADAVPQIVWITDAHGRMEFFNRQFTDYTGAPYEPLDPEVAARFIPAEDGAGVVAAFEAALATGAAFSVEHRIRSASGEARWFLARAEPYRDPATGRIVRWFGASVDIHDRKLAEERLRDLATTLEERVAERTAERNVLATLVETTDVLIMALDLDHNVLAINPANADEFERVYGVRPQAGDNVLALLADRPELQAEVRAAWSRGLGGERVTFVATFGDPARARPHYEVKFWPLCNDAGERIGAYQFVTDVTDRLRQEAQLAEAREALRQGQKMEALGQLTGGVAHDFNNLLAPIVASLDVLQRQRLGGEREQRLVAGAARSAERAKTLVQRLLAFARRQPLQIVPVDVARLVTGMGDLVRSTMGPQTQVEVEAAGDLPPAMADPNQLEMALLNLAVNARDAMPEGGTLRIAARLEPVGPRHRSKLQPGRYLRLSVADTGTGMDEATLGRAVEPFFSTKGIGKGTGLGLSMVHGLASQLGGALSIRSRPGDGTEVELWLRETDAEPASDTAAQPSAAVAFDRKTVLLVDDEELVRMSTADMLEDLGYAVLEAASAEEALRRAERGERFDLLVTDHQMPGMTGTDLARAIRRARPEVPVLLVSGYIAQGGTEPGIRRLTKPFLKDELASSLALLAASA